MQESCGVTFGVCCTLFHTVFEVIYNISN